MLGPPLLPVTPSVTTTVRVTSFCVWILERIFLHESLIEHSDMNMKLNLKISYIQYSIQLASWPPPHVWGTNIMYRYSTTTVIKWAFKPKMSFKLLNTIETANTIFVEILIKFLLLLKFKISLLLKIT